jgi:chaperone modulatory protein CbpM
VTREEFLKCLEDLDHTEVTYYEREGWIFSTEQGFTAIDIARVRLIRQLRTELDINDQAIPIVLHLLDQLYETRAAVNRIRGRFRQLPKELQDELLDALQELPE